MALRSGTDQHRSLTSSHSCRVKELVSIHGLLTFFFFLCFLPAECSQNGLKPGGAAKTRKGWFSCRCCGIMRRSPLQTECYFTMPISATSRCNLQTERGLQRHHRASTSQHAAERQSVWLPFCKP